MRALFQYLAIWECNCTLTDLDKVPAAPALAGSFSKKHKCILRLLLEIAVKTSETCELENVVVWLLLHCRGPVPQRREAPINA